MNKTFFWAAKQCRANQMRYPCLVLRDHRSGWEIMNMTCLIITNHESDLSGLSGDHCCDHNPELSHHDQPDRAQPLQGAAYNGKCFRFSFSQCFLNQSRYTQEKVGGRTQGKLNPAFHWPTWLLIGPYKSRDLNTGLWLVGAILTW